MKFCVYEYLRDYLSFSLSFIHKSGVCSRTIMIKPCSLLWEAGRELLAWVYGTRSNSPILELPLDMTQAIVERLSLRDRIRMGSVCKSWRQLVDICCFPETPWLLLLNSFVNVEKSNVISFYSMSDECYIDFDLPKSVTNGGGWCCFGSSNGWLFMATEPDSKNHRLFLLDPLSGVTLDLPSLATLPFFDEYMQYVELGEVVLLSMIEWNMVFYPFGDDNSDLVVAASFQEIGTRTRSAMCKPNDKVWTIFHEDPNNRYCYGAGFFFYEGTLYAGRFICVDEPEEERSREIIVSDHAIFMEDGKHLMLRLDWDLNDEVLESNTCYNEYLVESMDGELLQVIQYLDTSAGFRTEGFDIFRYRDKEKLTSLDDQVLFVGPSSGCSSVSARNSNRWFQRNRIYYESMSNGEFREFGAFDVQHKRIVFSFQYTMNQTQAPAYWFTPNRRRSSP